MPPYNIARTDGWTTGWSAVVVGWSTFFLPFLFVTEPSMLMNGHLDRRSAEFLA